MSVRDYSYYEAHAPNVKLDEIISPNKPVKDVIFSKRTLQRLRDGNLDRITVRRTTVRWGDDSYFAVSEGDDLGWLGYFIGRSESLRELKIDDWSEDNRWAEDVIHALSDGIARNRSIQHVIVGYLSNDGFAAIMRTLGNLTQLETLTVNPLSNYGDNDHLCVALGNLLESGVRLKHLSLDENYIGDVGVTALVQGLRCSGSSLKVLDLCDGSIGSEGLSTLTAALTNCTRLERLDLSYNNFSMAAAGLRSLSDWLQTATLTELRFYDCGINDRGLRALAKGAVNHCKLIDLKWNTDITTRGLKYLSKRLQSGSCRLERLILTCVTNDHAEVLARGLAGNKTLKCLQLFGNGDNIAITPAGWLTLIKELCDTSSINNIYNSNHTVYELWEDHKNYGFWDYLDYDYDMELGGLARDLALYLRLNEKYPQHAARCKILVNHKHLDMTPLLRQLELKCLPLVIGWFERAKPCIALPWYGRGKPYLLEESAEYFESRILTALYEFVHWAPGKVLERRNELILVAAYDDKVASLLNDVQRRDRKIAMLEQKLSDISQLARS
jgi:Ran GTPase-activating protein (RanGAP) involved in mRNA processing and transport